MSGPSVPDHIEALTPYPPGKPIQELERELGLSGVIKLASNENPFGPSPKAAAAAAAAAAEAHRYPDGSGYYLKKKLAEKLGQPPERFVLGCGTNEIIDLTVRVFVGRSGKAVIPHPSFSIYSKFLQAAGAEIVSTPLAGLGLDLAAMAESAAQGAKLVVICNPNNPTGAAVTRTEIADFVAGLPEEVVCLIDEAYIDFVREPSVGTALDLVSETSNVIVSRTFSKIYGLAGLRVGFGVMSPRLADYLNRVRQPFNVTAPALAAAEAALDDEAWLAEVKERTWAGLDRLAEGLRALGLDPQPTQTNFVIFRTPVKAAEIYQALLRRGIITRAMGSFGLEDHLRINVGTAEENERLLDELAAVLEEMSGGR